MTQWDCNPILNSYSLVALLTLGLMALLLVGPNYKQLPRHRRAVLTGLRLAVILLLMIGMLRPTLVNTSRQAQSGVLVILFDQSRCMQWPGATGSNSRWQSQQAALRSIENDLRDLMDVTAHQDVLTVRVTDRPGAYRLKGFRGGPVTRGFSVNLTPGESDLRRLSLDQLESMLGKDRYQLARNRDEIVLEVGHARVGREFYPYLMALLVIVVGLEHLFSNRFYRKPT